MEKTGPKVRPIGRLAPGLSPRSALVTWGQVGLGSCVGQRHSQKKPQLAL